MDQPATAETHRRLFDAAAFTVSLVVEISIAVFAHDAFIRPYVGDVLAVVLVYCALRATTPLRQWPAIAVAFVIACAVEFGQYFNILDWLGLRGNALARVVLGTGFEPADFLAYAAGAVVVALGEALWASRRQGRR